MENNVSYFCRIKATVGHHPVVIPVVLIAEDSKSATKVLMEFMKAIDSDKHMEVHTYEPKKILTKELKGQIGLSIGSKMSITLQTANMEVVKIDGHNVACIKKASFIPNDDIKDYKVDMVTDGYGFSADFEVLPPLRLNLRQALNDYYDHNS